MDDRRSIVTRRLDLGEIEIAGRNVNFRARFAVETDRSAT